VAALISRPGVRPGTHAACGGAGLRARIARDADPVEEGLEEGPEGGDGGGGDPDAAFDGRPDGYVEGGDCCGWAGLVIWVDG